MRDYLVCLGIGLGLAFAVLSVGTALSARESAQTRGVIFDASARDDRLW